MNTPFTLVRSFLINFAGTPVEIDAEITHCAYQIMRASCPAGRAFDVSLDHLEIFEQFVEDRITSTTLQALDLDTYQTATFTVHAYGNDILAIVHESGHTVERNSPTWTEVAESWHLDRQYAEAVESDQPQAAAAAGFLRPVPVPQNSGIGYRRAA